MKDTDLPQDDGGPINVRQPIAKSVRFEVFKRDKFTCQYCGAKAPDAVLHVDHIRPVAEGGRSEIMNLATSCQPCNAGKGARLLDDASIVERQRRQIEDLEERRQQLEMLLAWRDEVQALQRDVIQIAVDAICSKSAKKALVPNEHGRAKLKRWIGRYGLDPTLTAIDQAFENYYDGTERGWESAFRMIGRFLSIAEQQQTDPHIRDIIYIQGILRNRLNARKLDCVDYLREMLEGGVAVAALTAEAKRADTWAEFDAASEWLWAARERP